jgi:hypothetical protein
MAAVPPAFCRLNLAMWRSKLLFAIFIALPALGWCDVVKFTVDPANIGIVYGEGDFDLFSSGLNGTVLAGQSLSLDLVLSNDVLARLFLSDPSRFGIELNVYTNAGTFPGFLGPTTGFLLDPNGKQFGDSQVAGRGDGDNGTTSAGLVSFTRDNLAGAHVVDISGVHFDTSFPDTGFVVTNAQLRFSQNGPWDGVEFGTAQQLPEPSTFWELVVVLVIAVMKATGWQVHSHPRFFCPRTVGKK